MAIEKTFSMLKPGVVQRRLAGEIIARIERKGLKITALKMMTISGELAETHYAEHREKSFFGELVSFIVSGPVVAMVIEGEDAIARVRGALRRHQGRGGTAGHYPRRLRDAHRPQYHPRLRFAGERGAGDRAFLPGRRALPLERWERWLDLSGRPAALRPSFPNGISAPSIPPSHRANSSPPSANRPALSAEFLDHLEAPPSAKGPKRGLGDWLAMALELEEASGSLFETLYAYAYAVFSADTGNAEASAQINAMEELGLPLKRAEVLFRNALASRRAEIGALLAEWQRRRPSPASPSPSTSARSSSGSRGRWSPELEELAADLQRSGGDAWGRLQESITSSASAEWKAADAAGPAERKTLVELRNLAYDADRTVREKAYRLELGICESAEDSRRSRPQRGQGLFGFAQRAPRLGGDPRQVDSSRLA